MPVASPAADLLGGRSPTDCPGDARWFFTAH
jgi:hypothetical protein